MAMYGEYFTAYKAYRSKYGERTFLLYQVGAFFEVYAKKSDEETYDAIKIYSEICDLAIAHKQNGVYMAGFRDFLLEKYIEKIHPHGYTVVVCAQEECPAEKTKKFIRKEVGIYSPGTTISDNSQTLSNHMSCIWIQKVKTFFSRKKIRISI